MCSSDLEYIEGVNVRDLVAARGPLSIEDTLRYSVQVAEALQHAALRDVVHRDIKPSNLIVTPDGRVKLVDMGLARLHQVESPSEDLTASGMTLGTFDYISPEQARDPRSADTRSDLYSLGCTIYFMLTGRPPFPEGTVLQKLLSHSGDQPADVRQFRPELPDELCRILNLLLAKQPTQRFQSPEELVGALLVLALLQFPGAVAFALDGALIGAHDRAWLARQAIRNIVAFLPLALGTLLWPRLGLAGLWGAQLCWMTMRATVNWRRWVHLAAGRFVSAAESTPAVAG